MKNLLISLTQWALSHPKDVFRISLYMSTATSYLFPPSSVQDYHSRLGVREYGHDVLFPPYSSFNHPLYVSFVAVSLPRRSLDYVPFFSRKHQILNIFKSNFFSKFFFQDARLLVHPPRKYVQHGDMLKKIHGLLKTVSGSYMFLRDPLHFSKLFV